jgi:hypothetical protein
MRSAPSRAAQSNVRMQAPAGASHMVSDGLSAYARRALIRALRPGSTERRAVAPRRSSAGMGRSWHCVRLARFRAARGRADCCGGRLSALVRRDRAPPSVLSPGPPAARAGCRVAQGRNQARSCRQSAAAVSGSRRVRGRPRSLSACRTAQCSGPRLAMLAPAFDRGRSPAKIEGGNGDSSGPGLLVQRHQVVRRPHPKARW